MTTKYDATVKGEIEAISIQNKAQSDEVTPQGPAAQVVKDLERSGRKVQVIGRVVNGRVVIDRASLDEMAAKFPNAEMSFVAVNAPFDPVQYAGAE